LATPGLNTLSYFLNKTYIESIIKQKMLQDYSLQGYSSQGYCISELSKCEFNYLIGSLLIVILIDWIDLIDWKF